MYPLNIFSVSVLANDSITPAYYHAMSHGNERRNIVIDDWDRPLFLEILGRICEQYSIEMKFEMVNHRSGCNSNIIIFM